MLVRRTSGLLGARCDGVEIRACPGRAYLPLPTKFIVDRVRGAQALVALLDLDVLHHIRVQEMIEGPEAALRPALHSS